MFTREENLVFQNYLQKMIERPRRIQDQWSKREGIFVWCQDWEIIEILKCCFNGTDYRNDPPPNRLKFNPLWTKEAIMEQTKNLIETYKTPEAIVAHLQALREGKV